MDGTLAARALARLAGNLGDFSGPHLDDGLLYLLDEAGRALGADNCQFAVCVRRPTEGATELLGWQPQWATRRGPDSDAYDALFSSWYGDPRNLSLDQMVVALAQIAGRPRALRRRDAAADDLWRRSPVQELFDGLRVRDRLAVGVPVDGGTEVMLTSYRRNGERDFSEADRDLALGIATAVRPFCTRVAFARGYGLGMAPLTPREQSVLRLLLTGASEKEVAAKLGLTASSLHQYVVAVYRKLEVSSRAELMARFLTGKGAQPREPGAELGADPD